MGLSSALTGTALAAPGDPVPAGSSGADRFGSCLAAVGSGDLLILLDQSLSLVEADPGNLRIDAATSMMAQLAEVTEGAGVELDVALAGFGFNYTTSSTGWTTLTTDGVESLNDELTNFAAQTQQGETDYWTAMDGARQELNRRAAANGSGRSCQAILWFSDGRLQLSPRPADSPPEQKVKPYLPDVEITSPEVALEAAAAAQESLCRPRGVMDQVRSSDIVVLAVGLKTAGAPDDEFDLMRAMATGEQLDGRACGEITTPVPGDFTAVDDLEGMFLAFDRINLGVAPLSSNATVCAKTPCVEGSHSFVLDSSISKARILGTAGVDGTRLMMLGPGEDEAILLEPGEGLQTAEIGDVEVQYRWLSPRTVSVTIDRDDDGEDWTGQWSAIFVADEPPADATTRTNIHIGGDLLPSVTGDLALVSDTADNALAIGLVDRDKKAVDPQDIPGTLSLDISLIRPDGEVVLVVDGLGKDSIADPQSIDLTGVPQGEGSLRLSLQQTTAPATDRNGKAVPGTELSPAVLEIPVVIAPVPGTPTLATVADFGTIEGTGPHPASITVTGPGCAWVPPDAATLLGSPDGAGAVTVTSPQHSSPQSCLQVADGATAQLPIVLELERNGRGGVTGDLDVSVSRADRVDNSQQVAVSFRADVIKPLDQARLWTAFVVVMVIGLGVPLLLLYLLKFLAARIPKGSLRALDMEVQVRQDAVWRGDSPLALHQSDYFTTIPVDSGRSISVLGDTLRARMGWSLTGTPYVQVDSPVGPSISGEKTPSVGSPPSARLPIGARSTWYLTRSPGAPAGTARLVLLLPSSESTQATGVILARASQQIPALIRRLEKVDGGQSRPAGGPPAAAPTQAGGPPPPPPGPGGGGPPPWTGGFTPPPAGAPGPGPALAAQPWNPAPSGGSGGPPPWSPPPTGPPPPPWGAGGSSSTSGPPPWGTPEPPPSTGPAPGPWSSDR